MSKKVTMVIEDTIAFLTNPVCEFVSLVKRGANQAPFKVLKSEQGGKSMNKIVQAVLVPHSLSEEDKNKVLEGYRTDEVKEHEDFFFYVQVAKEDIVEGSEEMREVEGAVKHFVIMAQLKADKEDGEPVALDELYKDLYSTADIIATALRQKDTNPADLMLAINTAIDNFKAACGMALQPATKLKEFNPADHPTLLYPFIQDPAPVAKGDPPSGDPPAGDPHKDVHLSAQQEAMKEEMAALAKRLDSVDQTLAGYPAVLEVALAPLKTLIEGIGAAAKALDPRIAGIEENIEKSKRTLKNYRTVHDTIPRMERKPDGVFKGTMFGA